MSNTVFQAVSYLASLLGCLPELSNNNNQLNTSYALLRHDCFNLLTNIDLVGFIPTRGHTCDYNSSSSLGAWLTALREH